MSSKVDNQYYTMRAQQELDMAASATDPAVKTLHLNMAAAYTALREQEAGSYTLDCKDHDA